MSAISVISTPQTTPTHLGCFAAPLDCVVKAIKKIWAAIVDFFHRIYLTLTCSESGTAPSQNADSAAPAQAALVGATAQAILQNPPVSGSPALPEPFTAAERDLLNYFINFVEANGQLSQYFLERLRSQHPPGQSGRLASVVLELRKGGALDSLSLLCHFIQCITSQEQVNFKKAILAAIPNGAVTQLCRQMDSILNNSCGINADDVWTLPSGENPVDDACIVRFKDWFIQNKNSGNLIPNLPALILGEDRELKAFAQCVQLLLFRGQSHDYVTLDNFENFLNTRLNAPDMKASLEFALQSVNGIDDLVNDMSVCYM